MSVKDSEGATFSTQACEYAGIAIIAGAPDLRIRVWNVAAERLFGAAADRKIGSPIAGIFAQEYRAAVESHLRDALESGRTSGLEIEDRDGGGNGRELVCAFAPVISNSGDCIGVSVSICDITARISKEREQHQSRKLSSLAQLAGAIAHHFNNILGGVITSIDYALSRNDPVVANRILQQANRGLLRASSLVDGLLAFAEGDRRGQDLSDLTEIVNDLVDDLEKVLAGKGIRVVLEMPKLPVIPVGRSQLTTVLRNLTQNAVEAMPGGGTLTLQVEPDGPELAIRVMDTGTGLDQEAISHLFEPFWTTKGRLTAGVGEGAGLGLAMAHGIVQMMGGRIEVSSAPGSGATFTVLLPRPGDEARDAMQTRATQTMGAQAAP